MAITLNGTTGITAPGLETFGDGTALGGATNPIVSMAKGANNYVQGYIVNNTDGANASADLVCYPSNGTDSSGWIDMGITGPTFSQAAYGITGANEGYIFMSAPSGASKTGNLVLATDSTGTQNAIKFATGGFGSTTERMRIDSSGNVGIGTSSPQQRLDVTGGYLQLRDSTGSGGYRLTIGADSTSCRLNSVDNTPLTFSMGGSEKARIDSSGNLLVGTTSTFASARLQIKSPSSTAAIATQVFSNGDNAINWYNASGTYVASIVVNSGTIVYGTVSDYRLKENIAPMTGALDKVAALKPCTYTWKDSGDSGQGFIAHELQEIIPDAVSGQKDALHEDGTSKLQGVDTSFVVATLTAAIQEQQAIITQLQADIADMKVKLG